MKKLLSGLIAPLLLFISIINTSSDTTKPDLSKHFNGKPGISLFGAKDPGGGG